MGRRGRRVRIARGIYRDGSGISAVVEVRGHREEHRFLPGTPLPEIQGWRSTRLTLLDRDLPGGLPRGTLGDLIDGYVERLTGARQIDRRQLLAPWRQALGDQLVGGLLPSALAAVVDGWRREGLSASRANKRISALRVAWRAMLPDALLVPAAARVTRHSEPRPVTRGVSMALLEEVLAHVVADAPAKGGTTPDPSKSLARLRVLAWTGQPPVRVMAIEPHHVRWKATPPELYVSPRRKGAGADDAWLPLLPQAVTALKGFFAAKATGRFELSPLGRTLTRAVKATQLELRTKGRADDADRLTGLRVYDLRHSFLSALASHTEDIYAVAEYAGHASLQTTRRYMRAASSTRMKAGIAALAVALPVPRKGSKAR